MLKLMILGSLQKSKEVFETERGHILNTYMAILYDNECFEDLVNICDAMLASSRSQCATMLAASLCRIGTKTAYDQLLTYNNDFRVMKQTHRITLITAYFALQLEDFSTCLDNLNFLRRGKEYEVFPPKLAPTNLYILHHLRGESVESALNLCQKWIENVSEGSNYKLFMCQDVFEELENAVKVKPDLQESWTDLTKILKRDLKATIISTTLEEHLFTPMDLAPNPKKAKRKEEYESRLKERNLFKGAKMQKNQQDLSPELE